MVMSASAITDAFRSRKALQDGVWIREQLRRFTAGGLTMVTTANSTATALLDAMRWTQRLRDGTIVHIRPIDQDDTPRELAFLSRLTPEHRSYRFLGLMKDVTEGVARELTHVDPESEVVLIAIVKDGREDVEIGAARFQAGRDGTQCDCAVTVDPAWQKRGIGGMLMRHLIDVARTCGIRRMYSVDAARCAGAHLLAERLGFHSRPDPEDPVVTTFELMLR
jgi:GNAT superfamily N-acetyltransferase